MSTPIPYRCLVTISRGWTDHATIRAALAVEHAANPGRPFVVVHGACGMRRHPVTGDWEYTHAYPNLISDAIADHWAVTNGHAPERHPANWCMGGKAAGMWRNAHMVNTFPDVLLAFVENGSRGATDCLARATEAGITTRVWRQP